MNKRLTTSLAASLVLVANLSANQLGFEPIGISASLLDTTEKDTTSATEIYTRKDIELTKSNNLYDFLAAQTSINVMPSYGSEFTQLIDLRGYGIENGYENVAVIVDGRRLNNIDGSPQLLSAIPLESIEKIEIIKGSGSVLYGDGANAGVINIVTNGKNSNYIKTYFGNNNQKNGTVSLGYSNEKVILNAFVDYTSSNGDKHLANNDTNDNYNKNKDINLRYFPMDDLELKIGRSYSNMNVKYGDPISKAQYEKDPSLTGGFTEQYLSSYVTKAGISYSLSTKYSVDVDFSDEDKVSKFPTFKADYETRAINGKLNIKTFDYKAVLGLSGNYGKRDNSFNKTSKDNKALFFTAIYNLNKNTKVNFGARREFVEYENSPSFGTGLKKEIDLNAYNIGLNYALNKNSSIFVNYNRSFQAPHIDRFFSGNSFNGFIEPAKVNNFTIGYNNIQRNNKLKVSIFRSNLKNEMYYYNTGSFLTSYNTNIDKSHKYGFELFDKYKINENLFTSINYAYVVAKIDEENEGNGAYNGKDLPGVSKHNVTLNVRYTYNNISSVLSHTYKSSAYALNDFENNFSQKQEAYNSTDLNVSYKYKNLEIFGKVQNIFDEANGLQIKDDAIYPVNFERSFYAGVKVNF